jgi:hypothetical protein
MDHIRSERGGWLAGRNRGETRRRHGWGQAYLAGVERDDVLEHRLTNQEHGEQEEETTNSPQGKKMGAQGSGMAGVTILADDYPLHKFGVSQSST